ncbi:hypothetical protein [Ruegeria profundi]|uniref:Uncharacterized protein n=1 Tax=Ruegeria profundi TaxID=1685378 RepID=A0A0X3TPU5_9RHOB|nr:hypothetical protein [Ruegeria profundi]KUJ77778.1 hypothetical protein AVO44_15740 [Ruegeria profundi]
MMNFENKGHGRTIVMALIAILVGGIAVHWSWNTLAVELFAQPEMTFRHAIAVELLLIAVGSLIGLPSFLSKFRDA